MKKKKKKKKKIYRKLWNMKVTVIPIVIGALGRVTREWVQGLGDFEIRGRVENI